MAAAHEYGLKPIILLVVYYCNVLRNGVHWLSMDIVDLSRVKKQLKKVPSFVVKSLNQWVRAIELDGLFATQKIPGYHDEPLRGERKGQRSARLNRKWRVVYTVEKDQSINIVRVEEVMAHDYRTK
jgi:toxin HigB-1